MWYETYDGRLLNLNLFEKITYNQNAIEFWKDGKVEWLSHHTIKLQKSQII